MKRRVMVSTLKRNMLPTIPNTTPMKMVTPTSPTTITMMTTTITTTLQD